MNGKTVPGSKLFVATHVLHRLRQRFLPEGAQEEDILDFLSQSLGGMAYPLKYDQFTDTYLLRTTNGLKLILKRNEEGHFTALTVLARGMKAPRHMMNRGQLKVAQLYVKDFASEIYELEEVAA